MADSSCVKIMKTSTKNVNPKPRKVVPRGKLYQDPDLFEGKDAEDYFDQSNANETKTNDWTSSNFKRAGENTNLLIHRRDVKNNCIKKPLDKDLAKPVESRKAESMMMRMGWQGGGLGKAGDGILEPIVPHTSNIQSNFGLGHNLMEEKTEKAPLKPKKPGLWSKKEYFKINTLLYILDFVKDDRDLELVFDCKLTKAERKTVHNIVGDNENNCTKYESNAELDLFNDVARCNKLELKMESEGEYPERYLYIYKEAPDHVYLVTPKDFEKHDEVIDNDNSTKIDKDDIETFDDKDSMKDYVDSNKSPNSKSGDDNDGKFREYRGNNEKDDTRSKINIVFYENIEIEKFTRKLTEFFIEFVEGEQYCELRFLGTFQSDQVDVINDFVNHFSCTDDNFKDRRLEGIDKALKVNKKELSVEEDSNGSV